MTTGWRDINHRYLLAALGVLRATLERHVAQAAGSGAADDRPAAAQLELEALSRSLPAAPLLERLRAGFGLSPFERDLVLLCAAVELDAAFAPLCAAAQGDPARTYPTFSLALAALPSPHWDALAPGRPLRRWRLIEVGAGPALTLSPLRIDERALHYLLDVPHPDEKLIGLIEPVRPPDDLVPSHRRLADQVAAAWSQAVDRAGADRPVVQLCGDPTLGKRAIAAAACAALGLQLSAIPAESLPTGPADLWSFIRLWEREAVLSSAALLLDCDDLDATDVGRAQAVTRLTERLGGLLLIASRERRRAAQRPLVAFDVPKPTTDEQRAVWQMALGPTATHVNGHIDLLIGQFDLSAPAIQAAAVEALGRSAPAADAANPDLGRALWDACRQQARPRLDDLAQRLAPVATWDDLVLPEAQHQILREVAIHVRRRALVYDTWGFAGKGARGLGISALFAGASGTGKTMAAEVLANELHLDLYRIDLSATVSKYIGETEKNLRRIFDAAEDGGAILLFDEADALFGKRGEVKDSHDRYANIEVGYLLQRMEAYRGLAVLTTNLKNSLDTAFLRRLRFVVQFPFPDLAQRAEIWRRIFPLGTPVEALNLAALARLNVAGGNIRNIALNAAFLAADAAEPVRMVHLLRATQGEYAKLEKPLTEAETAGWLDRAGPIELVAGVLPAGRI